MGTVFEGDCKMTNQEYRLYRLEKITKHLMKQESLFRYSSRTKKELLEQQYLSRTGKKLCLSSPQTFGEKLQWLKLYGYDPLARLCANKLTARDYVREKGFALLLHSIYCGWDRPESISFNNLPASFIVKAAHASGLNLIVTQKEHLDIERVRRVFRDILRIDYSALKGEWVYEGGPHVLLVEELFPDLGTHPVDYKFFCFHGKVKAIQVLTAVDTQDLTDDTWAYFCDDELNPLPITYGYSPASAPLEKPSCFTEMKEAATALSEDFRFVRVDFCVSKGRPWFGEFTFFPGAGYDTFDPDSFDTVMGGWLHLEG